MTPNGTLPAITFYRKSQAYYVRIPAPTDTISRWGGDEFAMITHESKKAAPQTAERMRHTVSAEMVALRSEALTDVTMSFGMAEYLESDTFDTINHQCRLRSHTFITDKIFEPYFCSKFLKSSLATISLKPPPSHTSESRVM